MIYLKTELKDGKELKIDVYGDEFYCLCPGCGKEVHLDDEMVKHCASDGDFGSTSFYCKECTKKGATPINIHDLLHHQADNLMELFGNVNDKSLKDDLIINFDTYAQLIYNYLSDLEDSEKE